MSNQEYLNIECFNLPEPTVWEACVHSKEMGNEYNY